MTRSRGPTGPRRRRSARPDARTPGRRRSPSMRQSVKVRVLGLVERCLQGETSLEVTTVETPAPVEVTIVGIATFGTADGLGPTTFTAFTLEGAGRPRTGRAGCSRLRPALPCGTGISCVGSGDRPWRTLSFRTSEFTFFAFCGCRAHPEQGVGYRREEDPRSPQRGLHPHGVRAHLRHRPGLGGREPRSGGGSRRSIRATKRLEETRFQLEGVAS
jgi:hypothetical protein